MKLLLVGLDALDIQYFENSNLHSLKQMREAGQWGTLKTDCLWSGPNWTTIFTGLTKENHGVTDSLGRPFDSEWIGSRPRDYIWDILGNNGYTVGVMNFPGCYVARDIGPGSWMVGGWNGRPSIAPNQKLPPDFYTDLPDYAERGIPHRRPKGAMPGGWAIHEIPWKEYAEWAIKNYTKEIQIAASLPKVDIMMIQCSVLDRAGHMLSTESKGGKGTMDKRFKRALSIAEYFLELCVDHWLAEYTAIVSDHGFYEKKHSRLGTWALTGPDVLHCRNNTHINNFCSTILDAVGIEHEADGRSVLIRDEPELAEDRMRGLGYV